MDLEKFYLWSSIASFFVAIFIIIQLFLPNRPPEPPIPATQVIAHRGYWLKAEGLQNSLQSLHEAMKIGIYGSEFDVHMTADSQLIVFHDNMLDTIEDIRKANYENIHVHGLFNDLFIPTLADYFELGSIRANTKLVLDVKSDLTPERETAMVTKILELVAEKKVQNLVEYTSFSHHVCCEILRLNPSAKVAYMGGDITPAQAKEYGFTGICYHFSTFDEHPEWVQEAQDLGLTVNAWTVNREEEMVNAINLGVDFITTDFPEWVKSDVEKYGKPKKSK